MKSLLDVLGLSKPCRTALAAARRKYPAHSVSSARVMWRRNEQAIVEVSIDPPVSASEPHLYFSVSTDGKRAAEVVH